MQAKDYGLDSMDSKEPLLSLKQRHKMMKGAVEED